MLELAGTLYRLMLDDPEAADFMVGDLVDAWRRAEPFDLALRRVRTTVRHAVPTPVRRRARGRVGDLTSRPARRASRSVAAALANGAAPAAGR
jgi:hypothetical protein